jgi:hypothetical protein
MGEKMKRSFLIVLILAGIGFSYPDLVCPLGWKYLGSTSDRIIDSFEVHSYLENRGDQAAVSPLYPSSFMAVAIGVDSFNYKSHSIISLSAGYFSEFVDTITVIALPFSIHSHADPIGSFQNGYNVINDVYSYSINIHPTIVFDTVRIVLIDTLKLHDTTRINDTLRITLHDTTKITLKDTIRITKTDTITVHDTLQKTPIRLAKGKAPNPSIYGEIYNIRGQKVWAGYSEAGAFPSMKLAEGMHLFVQGKRKIPFRVLYR